MSQVCEICGDTGFADLLFICYQCKGAEHLYCILTQPDSDGEAYWSCETCKLKQGTITRGTVVSPLHSVIEQSQDKLSNCRRECQDSHPARKMQTLRSSDGTDALPVSKKQEFQSSNGIDIPQSRKKQELKSSNGTDFSLSSKKQVVESSNGTCSLPSGKKQELEISKGTNSLPVSKKQEFQSSKCMDSLLTSKKQSPRCSNHTDSVLSRKKEVVKSSFGTNSPPASEKQVAEISNCTSSLPTRKKQELGSAICTDSIPVKNERVLENSKGTDSLPARKKQATESSNDTDLLKESSENRPSSKQLRFSKAQLIPDLVSSGSKRAMLDKSWDSSYPNALELAKKSLISSKEIGSGSEQSSLHRESSKSKITVECKMELKKVVPAGSMKVLESTKTGSKLANKAFEKHKLSKMPESLSSMEVETERSRGLLAKGNSSGYDVVSAGVTNNGKEIDQSLIGKSTVEGTITANERDHEINNRSIEWNSVSQDMDKRKVNANAVSWNNVSLRSPNEYGKEKIGHSVINSSEINVPSSSTMENRSFNTCERGYMAGSMLSYTNCSSETSLLHKQHFAVPQSLILWKGTFKVVDIACGHVIYGGIQAHPSTTASPKVYEMTKTFGSQLYLAQVHRAEAWPKRFEQSSPTDDNVGLYFFPEDGKSERSFANLVEDMNKDDLAMRMHLDGAELLIFSSIQLPNCVQRIFGKFYLWGLFRRADKSTTDHKAQGASMQHDHVRADMADPIASSRSNDGDSVVVRIPNVHKNGVKGEMDYEMEGEKDVAISERPSRRMDSQPAGLPPMFIAPLSHPLDSEVNHFRPSGIKDDINARGCALDGQEQLLQGIRSKMALENHGEEASRRYSGKTFDQSHEWYHWSDIENIDGRSVFNSSAPHILSRHYSGKSQESVHERSNVHQSHEELTPRFGASNRIPILEENDEIELLTLQPQATNIKPGFAPSSRSTDCNPQPSSSDHQHEKQGFMDFQKDPRDQRHVFSTRSQLAGRYNSHQSSLSSGESDNSYGNKGRSLSQPTAHRKFYNYKDINRFNRSQSFKDHIGTQTKRHHQEDGKYEAIKLGMERHRERSRRHWQAEDGRTHVQMEDRRRHRERSHRHWQRKYGRTHVQMENCRSTVINNRVMSSDSHSNKGYMLEESSMHKDSSSYLHEKTSMHRWSSNHRQIQVKNCVDKDKLDMVDNFRSVKDGRSSMKREEGEMFLLDVRNDSSVIQSGEASDQYQLVKDQQSFTPVHTATDETAENNSVSEISNAASAPESPGQIYPGEIVPQILEADLPVIVNSRTEHASTLELDQNPLVSHGNWYAGSSAGQADHEPVKCLQLFPLEEENLGTTKNIVNEWDINLDLSLGRSCLKNVLKVADRQVCPNRSNFDGRDVSPCLGVSLPLEKRKETNYMN